LRAGRKNVATCEYDEGMDGRTIEVVVYKESNAWVATALNVGVSSCGDTHEDAIESICEALELYFEDADAEVADVADARIERVIV